MKKYTVILRNEAPVSVEAWRASINGEALTLLDGDQLKAYFPKIEAVYVGELPKPSAAPTGALRLGSVAEAALCEVSPSISIGSICITGVLPDSAAAVASLIQGFSTRADSPSA